MTHICDDFAYGNGPRAACFWNGTANSPARMPANGEIHADVAIIGAGFTGLSAALRLSKAGYKVVVLDSRSVGWGASGRNGGFCCVGGAKASDTQLRRMVGPQAARDYRLAERDAVYFTQDLIAQHRFDVDAQLGGETVLAHRKKDYEAFHSEAQSLSELYDVDVSVIPQDDLGKHGMSGPFYGAMNIPIGFGLNPRKYVLQLATAAENAGARIFESSDVCSIEKVGHNWKLCTPNAQIESPKVVVATNGYSSETVPKWMAGRYLPTQSSVIVTRPLSPEELAEQGWTTHQLAYDTRNLLHYFRLLPNGRFLFGMRGGLSTTSKTHDAVQRLIRQDFETMFPKWAHVETPWYWTGFVCLSRNLTPFAGPIPEHAGMFAGFGYHGNGVAMGSYTGALVADQIMGDTGLRLPKVMQIPPRKFPFGQKRRALMYPAYAAYNLKDR